MERPNTVAGLVAKRDELVKLRNHLEAEARKVTCDMGHLDAAIKIMGSPHAEAQRYAIQHRAQKGRLKRFVLGCQRDNPGHHTSRQITEAWAKNRGLQADEDTLVILRKRTGACLTTLRADGLVANGPMQGEFKTWGLS